MSDRHDEHESSAKALGDAFLDRFPPEARPEILAICESATIAARETFGPFNDEEDSAFFEAEGLSPTETWERLAERVAAETGRVLVLALAEASMSPDLVAEIHRRIFGDLFPESGGRFRTGDEQVQYSVVLGTKDRPVHRSQVGTSTKNLAKRLREACDEFNRAAAAIDEREEVRLSDLVAPAVKLYAKVLSIHPFMDGNGRAAFVVLQFALVRNHLLAVAMPEFEDHQWALGVALRDDGKQSYAELEKLVADKIRRARYDADH